MAGQRHIKPHIIRAHNSYDAPMRFYRAHLIQMCSFSGSRHSEPVKLPAPRMAPPRPEPWMVEAEG